MNATNDSYLVNGVNDNLYGRFDVPYKKFNGVIVIDSMFVNLFFIETDDSVCVKFCQITNGSTIAKIDSTRWEGGSAGPTGVWTRSQNILQNGDYTVVEDCGFRIWLDCVNDDNLVYTEHFVYLWYHLE